MKKASQGRAGHWKKKEDPGLSDGLSQQPTLLKLLRVLPWRRQRRGEESAVSTLDIKTQEWCGFVFFPELPITTVSTVSWSIIQVLIQSARSKDIVMTHVLTGK